MAKDIDQLRRKKRKLEEDIEELEEIVKTLDIMFNTLDRKIADDFNRALGYFNNTNKWKSDKKDEVGKDVGDVYQLIKTRAQEVLEYKKKIKDKIDSLDDDLDDICDDITEIENDEMMKNDGIIVGGVKSLGNSAKNVWNTWTN